MGWNNCKIILKWYYIMNSKIFNEKVILEKYITGVELVHFGKLTKYNDFLVHCFTTRRGGVSSGECSSLNLGFNRNDNKNNVLSNFRLITDSLNIKFENLVLSNQIHDNRLKIVDEKDVGKGLLVEGDIKGYDGLLTNVKNVTLVTFYADCIPIYILDPINNAIALLHSGWRSTYKDIAGVALELMKEKYKTCISSVEIVIGPSIGKCCFEIDRDVLELFKERFSISNEMYTKNGNDKWLLDLQGVIIETLIKKGIKRDNIFNSKVCTKCNNDYFFSHRGDNGKTGSLCAIMQLKEDKK